MGDFLYNLKMTTYEETGGTGRENAHFTSAASNSSYILFQVASLQEGRKPAYLVKICPKEIMAKTSSNTKKLVSALK